MENNPQVLLCIANPTIKTNLASQIIPPGTNAEILEAPDIKTAIDYIQGDTNKRIRIVIIGLFDGIAETLAAIMIIKRHLDKDIKTIFVYDPVQLSEEQGERQTHENYLNEAPPEATDSVDLIFPYPVNIPEMRDRIAALL